MSSAWVVTGGYGYGARRLSDGARCSRSASAFCGRAPTGAWARPPRRRVRRASACVMNVVAMELLRAKKIPSSGAYARSAERFSTTSGCRASAASSASIGYPFVQPVGWIFALAHHVPASTFEDVVGNWFLDRDGQWFQVQSKGTPLDDSARGYVISGLAARAAEDAGARHRAHPHAAADVRRRADRRALLGARSARARARRAWNGAPCRQPTSAEGRALRRARRARARRRQRARADAARRRRRSIASISSRPTTWWQKQNASTIVGDDVDGDAVEELGFLQLR